MEAILHIGCNNFMLYDLILQCIKKNKISLDEEVIDFDYDKKINEDFEPVLGGALTPGIQIRDLKKSYTTSWLRKSVSLYQKDRDIIYL